MFKRNTTLHLLDNSGNRYKMPVYPDLSYSQVYSEVQIRQKTLHNPENLISEGFTNKLNTGNFNFTIPLLDSAVASTVFSLLFNRNINSFTLFIENEGNIKELNTCVVSSITLNLNRNELITATISGDYSHSLDGFLEGVLVEDSSEKYTFIQGLQVSMFGSVQTNLTSISLEMSNSIQWVDNNYMQDNGPSYKTEYYCTEKVISGNVVKNEGLNHPSYSDNSIMDILIRFADTDFLRFSFPKIIVTSRPQLDEIIKKGFDFRVTQNENNIVKYKGVNIYE